MDYRHKYQNSAINAVYIAFIILAAFSPIRRSIYTAWTGDGVLWWAFYLHVWAPIATIVVLSMLPKTWPRRIPVNALVLSYLPLAMVLTALRVPGVWWTWTTLGVMLSTLALIRNYSGNLYLAIGLTSMGAGIWELAYQWGYLIHYYAPGGRFGVQLSFIGPMIMAGPLSLRMAWRHVRWTWSIPICLSIGVLGYALWYARGFWVDIRYDEPLNTWVHTAPFRYLDMVLYKLSKSFTMLAMVALTGRPKLAGYVYIPIWLAGFAATTAVIAWRWISVRGSGHGYFKSRSIYTE